MKKFKLPLNALAILAIVGIALGFRAKAFTAPTVYCVMGSNTTEGACPPADLVDYIQDDNGSVTDPCIAKFYPHITTDVGGHIFCSLSGSSAYTEND
jgi:hypothetical protein